MDSEIYKMAERYPRAKSPSDTNPCGNKWKIALLVAVLFIVLSSSWLYKLLQSIAGEKLSIVSAEGFPTLTGIAIMAVLFFLIARLLMW